MSRRPLLAAALALGLASCSTKVQVLEPRGPAALADAGLDAGHAAGSDAAVERDSALAPLDANVPARDAALNEADASLPPVRARLVSAFSQTCAVRAGALWCWGNNESGQVGVMSDAGQTRPLRVDPGEFIDVCTGESHSCALRSDGAAWCWGDNAHGQLGVGDFKARAVPTELSGARFSAIACGGHGSCGLSPRGALFCWGENAEGRLGQGDPTPQMPGTLPDSPLPLAVGSGQSFVKVSLGQGHVCAINDRGGLYCWGRNTNGQLGVRDMTEQQRAPVEVEPGTAYAQVAAGQRHTCAVDLSGKLLCWGETDLLGVASNLPIVRTPAQVGSDSDYASVAACWFHTCALKRSGSLQCWGRNEEGQLGLGDSQPRALPTRVLPELSWTSVAVGQFHTCAFGKEGLSCWGANDLGQLGLGDTGRRYVPIDVPFP